MTYLFSRRNSWRPIAASVMLLAAAHTNQTTAQTAARTAPANSSAATASSTTSTRSSTRPVALGSVKRAQTRFDRDLSVKQDIALRGILASHDFTFTRPRDWKVQNGTVLNLRFRHSPALLPDISTLQVSLNGTRLQNIALNKSNVGLTTLRVLLPAASIQGFNTLSVEVEQHYTRDCEYPRHASLWTNIARDSSIEWMYKSQQRPLDLGLFPLPFVDELAIGASRIDWLRPRAAQPATLTALTRINARLAGVLPFRPYLARSVDSLQAGSPTIVVGTPQEQPLVSRFLSRALPAKGGVLELRRQSNGAPLLLVTGRTSEDVLLAARALVQPRARKALSGATQFVTQVQADAPSAPDTSTVRNGALSFLPGDAEGRFTLATLGVKDQTVRGYYTTEPIAFRFASAPNSRFLPDSSTMTLRYSYSAGLREGRSTLELKIGDVSIKSLPLKANGANRQQSTFAIPTHLLSSTTLMTAVFHLDPEVKDHCESINYDSAWGTIHNDTSFAMPRDYIAQIPDLQLISEGFFPFSRREDLSETAFVLPADPSALEMQTLLTVSSKIGTFAPSNVALQVFTPKSLSEQTLAAYNFFVIGTPQRQGFLNQISQAQRPTFRVIGSQEREVSIGTDPYLKSSDFEGSGVIEEMISPWNKERVLVLLSGREDALLDRARRVFGDEKRFAELRENLVLVRSDGSFNAIDTGARRSTIGTMTTKRQATVWYDNNEKWLIGALTAFALFALLAFFRPRLSGSRASSAIPSDSP